jgi:hypothetical protein
MTTPPRPRTQRVGDRRVRLDLAASLFLDALDRKDDVGIAALWALAEDEPDLKEVLRRVREAAVRVEEIRVYEPDPEPEGGAS